MLTIARHTILGVSGLLTLAPALAAEDAKSGELAEIVVTASRRPVNLQKLPEAVSAISADRLDELNAQSFADYFRDVPGLMSLNRGDGRLDFSLRGVSSGQFNGDIASVDISTVSQYYDEIPVTASGFQLDARLTDIERIEVLRGPQGTYYGEGALGGTIRTITKKPVLDDFSASAEGRVSNIQRGGVNDSESVMLNLPLVTGKAALRLNGYYADDGGYIDTVNANSSGQITEVNRRDVNSARSSGFRGQLLFNVTDQVSVLGQAAHFDSTTHAFGEYQRDVGDLLIAVCPPQAPAPPPGSGGPGPGSGGPSPGPQCTGITRVGAVNTGNLYNITLNGELGWANLVSSSSYAKSGTQVNQISETTMTPALTEALLLQDLKGFTQEVRLVSAESESNRWDYVFGLYYQDKDSSYDFPPTSTTTGGHLNDFKAKQWALFADGGYKITERLQARLGLRESDVRNTGTITLLGTDLPVSSVRADSHFNPVSGRAVLNYLFTQDLLVYTSIGRGFRNGTINDTSINYSPIAQLPGYTPIPSTSAPDTTINYELGWKLSFPSRKATLNGAIYHIDWRDMQVLSYAASDPGPGGIPPGIAPAFVNAPRAAIDGLELEAGLELFRGLQARATWSLIDARLSRDFPLNLNDSGSLLHARRGDPIPFVARSSGSLSLNYRHSLLAGLDGFVLLNGLYQGARASDFNKELDTPVSSGGSSPLPFQTYFQMKSYWTTGLQIGIENARWRTALFIDNLTDARTDLFNHGDDSQITDRPRTVGVFVRCNVH